MRPASRKLFHPKKIKEVVTCVFLFFTGHPHGMYSCLCVCFAVVVHSFMKLLDSLTRGRSTTRRTAAKCRRNKYRCLATYSLEFGLRGAQGLM